MRANRKLYVFTGFAPDYTDGLACALAKNEEEARALIVDALGVTPSEWGEIHIHDCSESVGYAVYGGG